MSTPTSKNVQSSRLLAITVSSNSAYIPLDDNTNASEVTVLNQTGVVIDVREDNGVTTGSISYPCPDKTFYVVDGIINLNQVMVKLDTAGTPVTLYFRYKG